MKKVLAAIAAMMVLASVGTMSVSAAGRGYGAGNGMGGGRGGSRNPGERPDQGTAPDPSASQSSEAQTSGT